nr:DeoR/GlpR family DNA-binding transcription regulator [uncultured Anaeromusa sp.]
MLASERQKEIVSLLSVKTIVTIPEFVTTFQVSIETIRRDLTLLEKQGLIQKVYGGARLAEPLTNEPTLANRMVSHLDEKEAIGKRCSDFIHDGDCIFIDSGSTTYQIAKNLSQKKNLTVLTNSLFVINELLHTDFELIIIGGRIRHDERSVVTYDYIFNFSELNIQKTFLCAGGITLEKGVSDFNMSEAVTRKKIIERSNEIFVAADSSKFNRDVTVSIASLEKIDYIITDSKLAPSTALRFQDAPATLILAD